MANMVAIEIVARVAKTLLRATMRANPSRVAIKVICANMIHLLLDEQVECVQFWQNVSK